MDCAVLGDSIAVGVAQQRPECLVQARIGQTTVQYLRRHPSSVQATHVLISLGSNDGSAVSRDSLLELRSRVHAQHVMWLLSPNNSQARLLVTQIAQEHGDRVVSVRPFVGKDGVHPSVRGYRTLAQTWLPR